MKTRIAARCTAFALGVGLMLLSGFASAQNLVVNQSFETLNQAGWTSVLNTAACASWVDSNASPPTTGGKNGLTSSQGCPSSQILYQDITLPGTASYTLTVDVGCQPLGATTGDFCRIDITDTSAGSITPPTPGVDTLATTNTGVLIPVFSDDGTGGLVPQGTVTLTAPATAGTTIRIRIMVQANSAPVFIAVDSFSLRDPNAIPTLSELALVILSLLLVVGGMAYMQREGIRLT